MTIHELYNKRREEFQKYTIEAKIHEDHITELVGNLKAQLAAVENTVMNLPESSFRKKVIDVISDMKVSEDIGKDLSSTTRFREILETLASELESKIQVMLDGPV